MNHNSNNATAAGVGSYDDCCFSDACGKAEGDDQLQFLNAKDEEGKKKLPVQVGYESSKSANGERKNQLLSESIPPFMKISPILAGNSSDYSLSDCLSSANTHFSASISKPHATSESCENLSESLQVLLSDSEINTRHSIPGKLSEDFDTYGVAQQSQEEQDDQQEYPKVSITELESKGNSKSDSTDQAEQGIGRQARIVVNKCNESGETIIRKTDIVDKSCYCINQGKVDQLMQSDSRDQEVQMNNDNNNIAPSRGISIPLDENNQRFKREGESVQKYESEQDQRHLTDENDNNNNYQNNSESCRGMICKDESEQSYSNQIADLVKENDDPFHMIMEDGVEDDNEEGSTAICELQLDSEVLEQIQQIDRQEDEDESVSPTLRLHRVILSSKNSIEERIFQWLDKEGVIQVDPSQKREEYYNRKRDNLIGMTSLAAIPSSSSQIGSSSSIFGEMKMSSLRLCKITSSPLFNRRKLGREEGHGLQLQKVETTGKSYSQPIREEDEMIASNAGDGKENIEDAEESDVKLKNENLVLNHLSKFGHRAVVEGDSSEEDPQDQLIQRMAELQVDESTLTRQQIVPTLAIHRNLKRISLKLIHSSSSNSPAGYKEGKLTCCSSSNSIINQNNQFNHSNNAKSFNGSNPSTFNLNRKNTCDLATVANSTRTTSKEKSMIKLAS